jgi:hypothetical protein
MTIFLGIFSLLYSFWVEKEKKLFLLNLFSFFSVVLFGARYLFSDADTSLIGDLTLYLGVFNLFFSTSVFLIFKRFRLRLEVVLLLSILPVALPIFFGLSRFYWTYSLANLLIVSIAFYFYRPSRVLAFVLIGLFSALAATLQKYAVVYVFGGLLVLIRSKSGKFISFVAFGVIVLAFMASLTLSEFGSFSEFVDRRVTRESYEAARGETIFGVSDGLRVDIWLSQLDKFIMSPVFGYGFEWVPYEGVPNHNFIVTYLLSFGFFGFLLVVFYLISSFVIVKEMEFRYSIVGLLFLSLIGEGAMLPYIVLVFSAQAGLICGLRSAK